MTLRIRNEGDTSTLFEWDSSTKIFSGITVLPGKVHWVRQKIVKRTGNISHFMGSGDGKLTATMELSDGARYTNYQTIDDLRKAGTIIYLDVDDYNSNWSGKYKIIDLLISKNIGPFAIEAKLVLEEYNN